MKALCYTILLHPPLFRHLQLILVDLDQLTITRSASATTTVISSGRQVLETFLKVNNAIKLIRLQWVDFSGVMRVRFVPIHRCIRIADGIESTHLAQNSMIIPISTAPRIFSPCDYHDTWTLSPDWSSLRPCCFRTGHAAVMSFVNQDLANTPRDKCPRTLLIDSARKFEQE